MDSPPLDGTLSSALKASVTQLEATKGKVIEVVLRDNEGNILGTVQVTPRDILPLLEDTVSTTEFNARLDQTIVERFTQYQGLTDNYINTELLGSVQRGYLREFFSGTVQGALHRLQNFEVPDGLYNDTLLKYAVVAQKAVNSVNRDKSGLQFLRLLLVKLALKQRGF